jgi:16S rRNA (cytidine1402-2'-O)-methyltransferase
MPQLGINNVNNITAPLGKLYLMPTPLDFGCPKEEWVAMSDVLPAKCIEIASQLKYWVSENAKSTRAFLQRIALHHPLAAPIQQIHIQELPRHVHKQGDHLAHKQSLEFAEVLLNPVLSGNDVGLVSEAGMPAIADPGSSIVRAAYRLGIRVEPLVGPVSLMLALAASGMNGQQFAFVGYLPQENSLRIQKLRDLELLAHKTGQTQLFIETPYRNDLVLSAALQTLRPDTRLAVMSGMTLNTNLPHQQYSALVKDWKRQPPQMNLKQPSVFLIGV